MSSLPITFQLGVAFSIFIIGLYILLAKKNILRIILGIETMLSGCNIAIISIGSRLAQNGVDPLAQSIVIISIAIGAGVAALAVSLSVLAYRKFGTLDITKLSELRG
ncbi:MAG: NADH-quinone oxidoreductase subunit K [Nitrososphaeria archaeon]